MNSPRLALLIFDSDSLKEEEKLKFLTKIDDSLDEKAIVIIDSNYPKTEFKNLKLVQFSHNPNIGDTIRLGFSAALNLGVEKIVTFEGYAVHNAVWFLKYINGGNLIVSRKRNLAEMVVTEIANVLAFGNAYNGFSLNRIYTRDAAELLMETKLSDKAFLVESVNLLNSGNIPITEIISDDYEKRTPDFNLKESVESILKSFNRTSVLFSVVSSLSYMINLIAVYLSLSLGLFYPIAVLIAGEISGLSNFMMNEKMNFRNRGLLNSAYRLGKFNALLLCALAADILIISVIARYSYVLGKTAFTTISLMSIIAVSTSSMFIMNKFVWSKDNHRRVYLED